MRWVASTEPGTVSAWAVPLPFGGASSSARASAEAIRFGSIRSSRPPAGRSCCVALRTSTWNTTDAASSRITGSAGATTSSGRSARASSPVASVLPSACADAPTGPPRGSPATGPPISATVTPSTAALARASRESAPVRGRVRRRAAGGQGMRPV
ncbi:hypothetical protein AB3K78_14315 [Leucobacter sp. HNU]|uniref:hypothetical protein n=1 Tax=Leucobacter sp. HNU TaxID=3236805 RepID=UPI003A80FDF6